MKEWSIMYITYDAWFNCYTGKVDVITEHFDREVDAIKRSLELVDTTITMEIGHNGVAVDTPWDERDK